MSATIHPLRRRQPAPLDLSAFATALALAVIAGRQRRIPPRSDCVEYPGGHVWKRHPHEQVVLAAMQRLGKGEGVLP